MSMGNGAAIREPNGKNRRTARSYHLDNNKKSHLPFDAMNDGDVGGAVVDGIGTRSSSGSSTNRRKLDTDENVNVDSDENGDNNDDDDDDDSGDNENENDNDDRKIGFASISATKSNLSHMTWRTDNQRIRRTTSTAKKTGAKIGDDQKDRRSSSSSSSATTSIANEIRFSNDYGMNRVRNGNKGGGGGDGAGAGASAPHVAYLRTNGVDVDSRVTASNAMLVNNNNHLNNNNAIVDTFDAPPTAMELECVAGYDGGLPQYFLLEAYDSRTKKLRLNITSAFSDVPLFRIDLTGLFNVFALFLFRLFSFFFHFSFEILRAKNNGRTNERRNYNK